MLTKNPSTRKKQLRHIYTPLMQNRSFLKNEHKGLWAKRTGKNIINRLSQSGVCILLVKRIFFQGTNAPLNRRVST